MKYKLAQNVIDKSDISQLIEWLKTNPQLTMGPLTPEFEAQWAQWIGTEHALFCNSGSSANLLMAYALKVRGKLKNNKIIVPATGWVTTVAPFMQFGFEPIMCGTDKDTFGLDLEQLESLIKQHDPAAVMMVHVLGVPHKMKLLMELKKKYDFTLLEDACASLGAEYDGNKVGIYGEMSTFSFYFGHQLSTIEGGMVNTNFKEYHDILLMLRSHGWGKDLDQDTRATKMIKHGFDQFGDPFTFFIPGFNLRSTDLNAFLGLQQMKKADKITQQRKDNHMDYVKYLKGFERQHWDSKSVPCSIHYIAVARNGEHRKNVVKLLQENSIETRLFTAANLGRHPFWKDQYGQFTHPVSDKLFEQAFFLPNNESITGENVNEICALINSV
jgi:CDP-4-dehydro-6-deoxyglucose reductase, E1